MRPNFDGMHEALDYYLDFPVAQSVLEEIVIAKPELVDAAEGWGWTDTLVREKLIEAVAKFFGQHWPRYGDGGNTELVHADIKAAHDAYLAKETG